MITYLQEDEICSEAIVHNNVVYLSGQVAMNKEDGSFKEQVLDTFACTDQALKLAGTDKSKLLHVTIYLIDAKDYDQFNDLYQEWLKDCKKPARACVVVQLPFEGFSVELSVTAAI